MRCFCIAAIGGTLRCLPPLVARSMPRPRPRRLQIDGATFTCSVRVARAGVPAAVVLTAHGAGRHLLAVARLPADAQDPGGAPA
jgi:hypothetical protein